MLDILDLPLAKRPFEFMGLSYDAAKTEQPLPLYIEEQEPIHAYVQGTLFGKGKEQALTPWLSVADAVEKGFDFAASKHWLFQGKWFYKATGLAVENEPRKTLCTHFTDGWVQQEIKSGSIVELHYVAFKPIPELCNPEVLDSCKRVGVWNG